MIVFRPWRALLATTVLAGLPALPAHAETVSTNAALEARLHQLEAAVAQLRDELAAARATTAAAPHSPAPAPVAIATAPAPVAPPKPSLSSPARPIGDTQVKFSGFVKLVASASRYDDGSMPVGSSGADFYLPGAVPVSGKRSYATEFHAKQTRIAVNADTYLGGHRVTGVLEVDFQVAPNGNQRFVNPYSPGLRRAFITYDRFLLGQEVSTFQYVSALPETTDFLGTPDGTVFVRQAQIRYTHRLNDEMFMMVAAENPATTTITAANATVTEFDQDKAPDFAARLNWTHGRTEISLAGLARSLTAQAGAGHADSTFGWGVSGAGKIGFGPKGRHDIRFMLTHGIGIGRYVGLNLAPDAVMTTGNDGLMRLRTTGLTAGLAAIRLGWTDRLRSTVMGSFQSFDFRGAPVLPGTSEGSWSTAGNLFYTVARQFDVGVELRHGERWLVSGAKGQMDRIEFASKYSF